MDGELAATGDPASILLTLSVLRPKVGEVLLFKMPRHVPFDVLAHIVATIDEGLPEGVHLVGIHEDADMQVVTRVALQALADRPSSVSH
jgi:hypothetical protein